MLFLNKIKILKKQPNPPKIFARLLKAERINVLKYIVFLTVLNVISPIKKICTYIKNSFYEMSIGINFFFSIRENFVLNINDFEGNFCFS